MFTNDLLPLLFYHSRVQPSPTAATANPYLQSMYAASPYGLNPAAAAGLMSPFAAAAAQAAQSPMTQTGQPGQSATGNPLLDAYASHYAALAAAGYGGISNQPAVSAASVMNGLDQSHQGKN